MNKNVLTLAVGVLAGGALVYFLPRGASAPTPESAPAVAPEMVSAPKAPAANKKSETPTAPAPTTEKKPAAGGAWARLTEKFGAEKAALSKKITSELADVIDQGMALADLGAKNSGAGSVAEAASKEAMRNLATQLGLTEDQQQKASALIQSAVSDRMSAVTDLASAMRNEPEQMMELLLAGDALARKEITQEEYDEVTKPTRTMLQNLGSFVMGRPGAGPASQLLGDEAFTSQMNALLSPDQQAKLTELTSQWNQQAQNRSGRNFGAGMLLQNGNIPVMELAKVDESLASVKLVTGGLQLLMKGMKGLKDANPNQANPPAGQ